jgi:hypothetical protein
MRTAPGRAARALSLFLLLPPSAMAQTETTTMPSTLRYGSGLLDIPVAGVLPHLAVIGTYSGFFVDLDRREQVASSGATSGYGAGLAEYYADASFALGLFDRMEVGTTLQALNAGSDGGNMWGMFGRLQVVRAPREGLGLAVGARYVTAPDFGDGISRQPGRLGIPDERLRSTYEGSAGDVATKLSLYGVATAHVPGGGGGLLPRHDLTFSLGYGSGMFQSGGHLPFYSGADSDGWFFGSSLHVGLTNDAALSFLGEYNGFDVNLGAQVDVGGLRIGAHVLGVNQTEPLGGYSSEYRRPKLGVLVSLAACPSGGTVLCKPTVAQRQLPRVVQLPAPPPDTVVVAREVPPPLPTGTPALVCLSTGDETEVRVTAEGDTLVGPGRVPLDQLRPGMGFAGAYAADTEWYGTDATVAFEARRYEPWEGLRRLRCGAIERVGEYRGVPLFAPRGAEMPTRVLYVPVRPGLWQGYRAEAPGG